MIVGIWIPCAGSVTSWNTHLGSEEYEPDAKNLAANVTYEEFAVMDEGFSAKDITLYLRYFGIYYPTYENDMDLIRSTFNPCEWYHIHTSWHAISTCQLTVSHHSLLFLLIVHGNRLVRARY
jgi:hypothetical protein